MKYFFICLAIVLICGCSNKVVKVEKVHQMVFFLDPTSGISATFAVVDYTGKDTIFYAPRLDTVYKVDSLGKPTHIPLRKAGSDSIQVKLIYHVMDKRFITFIAPREFPL